MLANAAKNILLYKAIKGPGAQNSPNPNMYPSNGGLFGTLPPFVRGVIALTIVGGTIYGVYAITKAAQKAKATKGVRAEGNAVGKELDQLNNGSNTKQTLTQSQALQYANQLFAAMDGYGTGEAAIVRVFTACKNDADVLAVIAAYGVREVSSGRFNPEPNYKGPLGGALESELSQYWIDKLNADFQKKGIKHRF